MARGGGFGAMGNMNNMLKQAQRMQQNVLAMQQEMENKQFSASVGGGVVSAVVSGKKQLLEIKIAKEAVDPDDVEMLEDLVLAAVNEAMQTADEATSKEMAKLTGGMSIPGLM